MSSYEEVVPPFSISLGPSPEQIFSSAFHFQSVNIVAMTNNRCWMRLNYHQKYTNQQKTFLPYSKMNLFIKIPHNFLIIVQIGLNLLYSTGTGHISEELNYEQDMTENMQSVLPTNQIKELFSSKLSDQVDWIPTTSDVTPAKLVNMHCILCNIKI